MLKFNINASVLMFLFCAFPMFYGCTKTKKYHEDIYNSDKFIHKLNWNSHKRILGLLSTKYDSDFNKLRGVIIDYNEIHHPGTYYELVAFSDVDKANKDSIFKHNTILPKETTNETVTKLSSKYSINEETLGAILYDYEIYFKIEEVRTQQ